MKNNLNNEIFEKSLNAIITLYKTMKRNTFLNKHWFMYHLLEDEFLEIEKTIPVDSENSKTFSYTYMKLLGSICCEFNECFKNFSKFNQLDYNSINQYEDLIDNTFPEFKNCKIIFNKLGCDIKTFKPFESWAGENTLCWWEINNAIKHDRNSIESQHSVENYKLANQNCILTALSGLFQLNIYFYTLIELESTPLQMLTIPPEESKIFNIMPVIL